jgi:ribosome recycling factor
MIEVIDEFNNAIFNLRNIKECYQIKLKSLKNDNHLRNDFERNDIEIEELKIKININNIDSILNKKTKEFKEYLDLYFFAIKN